MNYPDRARRVMMLLLGAAWLVSVSVLSVELDGKCQDAIAKTENKEKTVSELDWQNDFYKALEQAKVDKKFVLVDVYTNWCVYCKKLDREVYTVPAISRYLTEHFILVKANAEDDAQGQAFADKFDAHSYPTILIFDASNKKDKPKSRISGYLAPSEFDLAMHSIVEARKYTPSKYK